MRRFLFGDPRVRKIWTSYWNPALGALTLFVVAAIGIATLRDADKGGAIASLQAWAWFNLALIPFHLLARWRLVVNFDSGEVVSTAGIWPFVRMRTTTVNQIDTVLLDSQGSRDYRLWLITKDGQKFAAGYSARWKSLVKIAHSMAALGNWRFDDASNGMNTAIRFVKKPKRTASRGEQLRAI